MNKEFVLVTLKTWDSYEFNYIGRKVFLIKNDDKATEEVREHLLRYVKENKPEYPTEISNTLLHKINTYDISDKELDIWYSLSQSNNSISIQCDYVSTSELLGDP